MAMAEIPTNGPCLPSSYDFQSASMAVQDALVVLAVRLVGADLRRNQSARQQIIALARAAPLFRMESYDQTERRINRYVNWAGTPVMDELFPRALDILRGNFRGDALEWAAVNAVSQQLTDEMNALLHHIGKALGFKAAEVETAVKRALSQASDGTIALD